MMSHPTMPTPTPNGYMQNANGYNVLPTKHMAHEMYLRSHTQHMLRSSAQNMHVITQPALAKISSQPNFATRPMLAERISNYTHLSQVLKNACCFVLPVVFIDVIVCVRVVHVYVHVQCTYTCTTRTHTIIHLFVSTKLGQVVYML